MKFVLDGWMYLHINIFVASFLLLGAFIFSFYIQRHLLIVSILYTYFGPLLSSVKLEFTGFNFDFTLALQFILISSLYLRSEIIFSHNKFWIINVFLLGIIISNLSVLYRFSLNLDSVKFLRYLSLGFIGSLNTALFVFYLNSVKYDLDKVFLSLTNFISIYGLLIICEGYFNYFSGISSYFSENISHNNQLYTLLGQGPDGIGRLILLGFLSTLYLYNYHFRTSNVFRLFIYSIFGGMILFLTLSRTVYILVLFIFFVLLFRSKFRILFLLILVLFIPIIYDFLASNTYLTENKSSGIYSMDTLFYRFDLLFSAFEVFTSNIKLMFTGVGYRMYFPFIQTLGGVFKGGIQYENSSFENKFLEVILETGLLGLVFTLYFIYKTFSITLLKSFYSNYKYRDISLQLLLMIIGSFVVNMDWIVLYVFYFIFLMNKFTINLTDK